MGNNKNNLLAILWTLMGKVGIMFGGFGTVWLTARLWGAEGRGDVAIWTANLSLAAIVGNVLTNGSACYFIPREGAGRLWLQAAVWSALCALVVAFFSCGADVPCLCIFFVSAFVSGLLAFHYSAFLAHERISYYNIATMLLPLLTIAFIASLYFFGVVGVLCFYLAQMLAVVAVFILCEHFRRLIGWRPRLWFNRFSLRRNIAFGLQEEGGAFFQFLCYRLPYYFLLCSHGSAQLGVFSIGVALSEAVWVVSRSISLVQYSRMLCPGAMTGEERVALTHKWALVSLAVSFVCLLLLSLVPSWLFAAVFGSEFEVVGSILVYLSPGILSVSASKVYAHFFSATGSLRILFLAPLFGAGAAALVAYLSIGPLGWKGACLATTVAHLVSSFMLFIAFLKKRRSFL